MSGIFILLFACVCQGSFGVGMKTYKPYKWENFRVPFVITGMLLVPVIILSVRMPGWTTAMFSDTKAFIIAAFCGVLWGVSAIWFDLAIINCGMAMTYGINFGMSATLGTLLALPFTGSKIPGRTLACLILAAVVIVIGIILITKAGLIENPDKEKGSKMGKGILYAIGAGLGSAAMNVGFTCAAPLGEAAKAIGGSAYDYKLLCWMPIFLTGCIPSFLYCISLFIKNRSFGGYFQKGTAAPLVKSQIASLAWFFALYLYAVAVGVMGEGSSTLAWIAFTSLALLISNLWGLYFKEWTKYEAKRWLLAGDAVLLVAFVICGLA
ncbi:MAG: hypothetical protein K6G60_09380 [Lachnospiraceae bacterium]|nr:hypothetical protein [Lachnospiraceae bacterium]